MSTTTLPNGLAYRFGRNMRGDLVAKTILQLGDADKRQELHIETSKRDGGIVEVDAVVFRRTSDGLGLEHSFAMSSHGDGDFRKALRSMKTRCTEKTVRQMHESVVGSQRDVNDLLNEARGFYVAKQAVREAQAPALAALRDADFMRAMRNL